MMTTTTSNTTTTTMIMNVITFDVDWIYLGFRREKRNVPIVLNTTLEIGDHGDKKIFAVVTRSILEDSYNACVPHCCARLLRLN